MSNDLIIGMAGSGGDGVVSAGEFLMSAAALEGYHAMMTKSFGSQIRGGESSCRLRISTRPVLNSGDTLDVAIVFDWEDFLKFGAELPVGGRTTVIFDESRNGAARNPLAGISPAEMLGVPLDAMARETAKTEKARNTIVLGLLAGWVGLAPDSVVAAIRKKLGRKGDEVMERAERAFRTGVEYAAQHPLRVGRALDRPPLDVPARLLVDGNDMCAASALFAGCQFFAGYPITPSSEIMQFFSRHIWRYGGTLLQCEDEIAGIGAVVGASFAGKKAMTATSGPGMSLKTEILGLATIAELPLVCVNVQRGGPSTGIPTKSEQADVFQAAFSSHGDAPRPVLAPVNVRDTFRVTVEAFNIAEQYQTPVIILSDQDIAQRKETVDPIDTTAIPIAERRRPTEHELEDYVRFRHSESGVSPISTPGTRGGNYLASGIEHNERGAPTASGEIHARMNEKRVRKLQPLKTRADLFATYGDPAAPIGLVSWGSIAGVAVEALQLAQDDGIRVKLLVPTMLYPVAEGVYQEFFASVKRGLVIEQSHQGQFYRVIRMYVDVPAGVESLARSGANPITPRAVLEQIHRLARAMQRMQEYEPTLG